jgi:hypothetical protein
MVNICNQIFNSLKEKINADFPDVSVQKEYQPVASKFPTVTFYEIENAEFSHTLDYTERASNLAFQIDIFTTSGTKESLAKQISKSVSENLENIWHMKRAFANPLTNAVDTDIYRYTMRYSCKIDEDKLRIYS